MFIQRFCVFFGNEDFAFYLIRPWNMILRNAKSGFQVIFRKKKYFTALYEA